MNQPSGVSLLATPPPSPAIGYCNFGATANPTVDNDETEGYSVNSFWLNITGSKRLFQCQSTDEGAAIWNEIVLIGSFTLSDITGTLAINKGGTGQTTANAAFNALAPSQASNADKFLKTDGTNTAWATVPTGLSIGDTLGNSPITNAVLHIGAGVVAQSQKFKFNGDDLFLANPTAATVGAQTQNSPYFYLDGAKWRTDTSASEPMRVRASVKPNATDAASINSPTLVFSFWSPGQNSFQDSLTYGNNPGDYLSGRLKLANPAFSGWGGMLDIYYDGTFFFKKLNGDLAPIGANHVGANPSAFPTLNFLQDTPFGISLNAYQGGRIRFAGGYPGTGVNALGSEWVQSDLPVSIGVGGAPSAKFHIIGTTEQQRIGYDASNYFKTTVASNGTVTFDGVGSAPGFVFLDKVELPIKKRVRSQTDVATLTPNIDLYDAEALTAQDQNLTIANPTGTPTDEQEFSVRIKPAFGGGDTLTFGSKYRGSLPATQSSGGESDRMMFKYDVIDDKWDLILLVQNLI